MLQVLVAISQKFCCIKEACGYAKVIHKKERDKKKNGQVFKLLKQWVLRCPPEKKKKKMNKIARVFLQSCFQLSNERYVFKEHSRIRLATIYIHHTSTHMHILIWLYDLTLFGSEVWLYNICIASMLFMFSPLLWAPHKPSCRKRKA